MPKGFTQREKELIRRKLHTEGTRLFGQYGIQKTTVDDIAKAAGISKGSFYGFYKSKEELFFDILENLDRENKERMSGDIFPKNRPFRDSFRDFLDGIFTAIDNASIMKKLNPGELEFLIRKLPEEKIAGHLRNDNDYFDEFYKTWKKKGVFKNVDPKGFTGIIKMLFFFVLHQGDFSPGEFPATKELLIQMLCEYLVNK